jgi:exonuclease III
MRFFSLFAAFTAFTAFTALIKDVLADTECPLVTMSTSSDRRQNNTIENNRIRIMQYNAQWLFIDYYNAMKCPGEGCDWINQSEAEIHMSFVAKRIRDINPDIINFCEVEGCDELYLLSDQLDSTYVPYLKKGTDTATGQNVGMLTRIDPIASLYRTEERATYPMEGSQCGYIGVASTTGVSKHYITEFAFYGLQVAFISAHLVAIPTEPTRCSQREGQAAVLQEVIVGYLDRNYEVIMIGDFNDYDGDILDMNGNKPTSRVLDILKGSAGDHAGLYQMTNIAADIAQKERYSDWWDSDDNCATSSKNDYSMIDHILVTDGIRKHVVNAFIYHEYGEYCGKYDSDHYPVVMDLVFETTNYNN